MGKLIADLDRQFSQLHQESRELVHAIPPERLYYRPPNGSNSSAAHSFGEQILRSAAAVEQTFGGITANLWDDPFEWTLPETLSTKARLISYVDEVRDARDRALQFFKADADLRKTVMAPNGPTQLMSLLLDALGR